MRPPRGVERDQSADARLREGFNDSLCYLTVEQGDADTALFCECGEFECQEFLTLPVSAFKDARAAERPILAFGHRPT